MLDSAEVCCQAADELHAHCAVHPRINVLGVGIAATTMARAIAMVESWRRDGRRDYACFVSVHGVVTAQRDKAVRDALNGAGLAAADGMPMVWWSRRAGHGQAGRVCGPDFMTALCARSAAQGHSHYFYGGNPDVLERLVSRLQQRHPGLRVAGYRSPPYRALTPEEDAADIAAINATKPDFVWVGLGMPKQEKWMAAHAGKVQAAALLGVGAAFDFHAGAMARAPLWMQQAGLEWLFRLASEPRRLAGRYLIGNTIFVVNAVQQLAGLKTYAQDW
jgi:N-acetylglucosaminyldiphosphoundecaprenol N-acetyl-beta-D-mannosaminyltransferase